MHSLIASTRINQLLLAGILSLVLLACSGAVPSDINIYQAQDIDHRQIDFVWIETPSSLSLGSNQVRVFMARTDPPGMLVPTETELPCIVQSADESLDLRPVRLPFEFDGEQLVGSYSWKACASCVECYMNWETTMEIVGTIEGGKMALAIGIRHMGHNIPDDYLNIELKQEKPGSQEPRILCRRSLECEDVEFVPRP